MKAERWQQVERLYHAALERGAEGRAAFIAEACAGDEGLRREVESLLTYEDQAEDFIESPALEVAAQMMAGGEGATVSAGQTINQYTIISSLGAGGMGEVYLAEDTRLGRKVALKFLPAHLTQDEGHLRRFEQEARAVAALSHPSVCTIHEVVETGEGRHCIVMEYVGGVTLRTRMRGKRLSLADAVDIALQIAGALSAAHAAGIVHRDIKPENVMVRPDGLVKVLDFGIAKYARPSRAREAKESWVKTATGVVVGTTAYMSPEQARGQAVDARTDVWALGVILYEMVASRLPFPGKTPSDRVAAILEREPEPLGRLRRGVPAELERIVGRALAKDRNQRYARVADLAEDLRKLRATLGAEAPFRFALPAPARGLLSSRKRRAVALAALLLVTAAALVAGLSYLFSRRSSTPAPQTDIKSLAVLPLENLSGDPAEEYFADGMTDALIGDLAKLGELRVISRTSSMHYKGTKKSLPEIAGELKVDAVVEGTVQRSGERVRIRVQLIHAATDGHLWAETYERDVRDVLVLQSEIAQAIAREVQIKITPDEQARLSPRRPINPKAFDDYLQGRHLLWNKRTEENLGKAIEYFQSAIREDPTYAHAYAGLADCYSVLGTVQISVLSPIESRQRAEEAAVKALELDGGLAEAHAALGVVNHYNWNWTAAEQRFKRAIELDPNYADAHSAYAAYLMSRGRAEEALAASNRARELDPLSLSIGAQRGFLLENARRYDEAIEQLRRVIAVDPNNYPAHWFLGHTYAANGQFDEAVAAAEKAVALSDRAPGALGILGLVYGLAGRKSEATTVLNELLALNERRYVTPAAIANVYIGLGDKDQAFVWLEKAYQERSYYIAWLKVFPIVDPLRSDPRFADLVRRVGLPQ
jgi:TolB-like protein/Flp pilus assembly protein TadD